MRGQDSWYYRPWRRIFSSVKREHVSFAHKVTVAQKGESLGLFPGKEVCNREDSDFGTLS